MAAVVVLAGCSGGDDVDAVVPTFPVNDDGTFELEGAMASGQLVRRDGCLGFISDNGGELLLIVWPEGTEVVGDSVRTGDVRLAIGDQVSLGGGEFPADSEVVTSDPKLSRCVAATGVEHVWVGTVGPAE